MVKNWVMTHVFIKKKKHTHTLKNNIIETLINLFLITRDTLVNQKT